MEFYEKMPPKWCPNDVQNQWQILWHFETCEFLFFAKSITFKSFFYMIGGNRNRSKIHKKQCKIHTRKKYAETNNSTKCNLNVDFHCFGAICSASNKKGSKKELKRKPRRLEWIQKGAKRSQTGTNKSTKMQVQIIMGERLQKRWKQAGFTGWICIDLGSHFQLKIHSNFDVKISVKKYRHLWEHAPKMMPERGPKSMTNRWFGETCEFLFFAKSITLNSFFTWTVVPATATKWT